MSAPTNADRERALAFFRQWSAEMHDADGRPMYAVTFGADGSPEIEALTKALAAARADERAKWKAAFDRLAATRRRR